MRRLPRAGHPVQGPDPAVRRRAGLAAVTDALAEIAAGADLVAGIDARGFLLGGSRRRPGCGTGVLAVRKGGKLPPPVLSEPTSSNTAPRRWRFPPTGIDLAGRNIVIIDDVLATGGTMAAAAQAARATPARNVTGAAVVLELAGAGRSRACSRRCRCTACTRLTGYPRAAIAAMSVTSSFGGDERGGRSSRHGDQAAHRARSRSPHIAPRRSRWRSPKTSTQRVAAGAGPAGPPDDRPAQRAQPGARAAGRGAPGDLPEGRPVAAAAGLRGGRAAARRPVAPFRRPVHHPSAGRRQHPGRARHGHHHAGGRAAARHRRGHRLHAGGADRTTSAKRSAISSTA